MSKVTITRSHNLDHDRLLAEVGQLADRLVGKYGGDYSWSGDQLIYRYGGGVTASVHCAREDVRVDVTFGMLMSMLKGPVTREIEDYLDRHLA